MAERSSIEWTESTWTPIRARFGTGLEFDVKLVLDEKMLLAPLRWRRPRRIFVCSMTDLFASFVPDAMIDRVFAIMALCPQHTFQVLTKRPDRMRAWFADPATLGRVLAASNALVEEDCAAANATGKRPLLDCGMDGRLVCAPSGPKWLPTWPLPNVWLGTSCEDQKTADARVPELLATPAAIRFVSAEPLLGPVDFETAWHGEPALDAECWGDCHWCKNGRPPLYNCHLGRGDWERGRSGLDWIIVGGESGPGARPLHPDWARSIRDQCAEAGVAFLFKQHGDWLFEDQIVGNQHPSARFFRANGEPVDDRPPFGPASGRLWHWWEDGGFASFRIGKKRAGRLLDGVEHNGMPAVAAEGAR